MVEANIKIIEELRLFLEVVSKEASLRELIADAKTSFTRDRKLTFERLVGIIINMPKRSLSIEIQEFFDGLGKVPGGCTKGAFSLQRGKLNPIFFGVWNKWLVDSFYSHYNDQVKRWRGFRLLAVDGSTAYLFNTEEVKTYFGTKGNQHKGVAIPMARVMQIHDILNDLTVWGNISPVRESEETIMARNIPALFTDGLTLFDRGFPGYGLMYLMLNEETPRHFIIRCSTTFNKEVIAFGRSSKTSKIVELMPSYKAIVMLKKNGYIVTSSTKLKVRMVQINLPGGQKEILLTSLYDEKLYSLTDLKYLYGLRWGIETSYSKQKNQLQMEQFSGHRVLCIRQDYFAGLFVANLQSLIEKQSDEYLRTTNRRRKYDYKVNRNISWASLKHNIVKLFLTKEPREILERLQRLFEVNIEPIRPGRKYERLEKARKIKGKYQTFTNYKRAL
jgi:hypothetical protein